MFNSVYSYYVTGLKTLRCGDGIFSTPSKLFLVFNSYSTPLKRIIVSFPVHAAIVLNSVEFFPRHICIYLYLNKLFVHSKIQHTK